MAWNRRKSTNILILGLAAQLCAGFAFLQLSVPDIESKQKSLFDGFDDLERLGAYVVGEDGEMLGKLSKSQFGDSLGNEYGAGSQYKSDGLFNTFSKYGSEFRSTSAFNDHASRPPEILVKKDGNTYSVGVLTINPYAQTKGQRINPYLLKAWLDSK